MQSSERRLGMGAVLAAHALLLGAWWTAVRVPPVLPPEPVLRLRLLPAESARPSPPVPGAAATRPRPVPAPRPVVPAAPPPAEIVPSPDLPAPAPAVEPAPPPLRLILPPPAPASSPRFRDQLLRDPRANSRPARGATDALRGLGDPGPRVAEETMAGEGRRRVRIGRDCFDVRESRMAQLDPHHRSAVPMPSQVESCD